VRERADHEAAEVGHGPAEGPWPDEPLALWEGVGVEIEMMIVDAATLDVRPVADRLMGAAADVPGAAEVDRGVIAWSNELALHVLELKTNGPARTLDGLAAAFQDNVIEAEERLAELGCRLMPGGMHPWMDPEAELRLWPHEYTEVYRTFDRIFSCRGHGWANVQSTHVNLPFRGDDEFARLHEAVRLMLPLTPALAASSPFLDRAPGPALDNRLRAYRDNARRVPSVTGRVVPERVSSRTAYRTEILERIYRDLEPHDPEGVLRDEWVNARGAIARFGRGSIEIRLLDAQECPQADLAVAAAVVGAVRWLVEGPLSAAGPPDVSHDALVDLLERTMVQGGATPVTDERYLDVLGLSGAGPLDARDVWRHLIAAAGVGQRPDDAWAAGPLDTILHEGTLAERLRLAAGLSARPAPRSTNVAHAAQAAGSVAEAPESVDRGRLREVYGALCTCLRRGTMFAAT
jgi:gamma-glutamyl:cysteine ligase YbdK (ATP-grasp superfamily)